MKKLLTGILLISLCSAVSVTAQVTFVRPLPPAIVSVTTPAGQVAVNFIPAPSGSVNDSFADFKYHAVLVNDLSVSLQQAYISGRAATSGPMIGKETDSYSQIVLSVSKPSRYYLAVSTSGIRKNTLATAKDRIYSGWKMYTTADNLPVQLFTGVDTTLYATGFYTGEVHSSAVAMITLAESGSTAKAFEINNGTTPVLSIADIKNVSTTVPILVVTNIKEAVSQISSATQTVIIKTIDGGTTYLTIYSLINNPLSASEITYRLYIQEIPSKKILAEGKIAISPDKGFENILSTTTILTGLPASIGPDTTNPLFLIPPGSIPDSLQVKLLASVLFHASIAHNSPKANEIEETAGIYTNYIQYFDNIVRNWGSVNDSTVGLPRLRAIYKVVKDQNAGVVADNVWALNHGTLAEFGKPVQERKNYAFYEGYSRLYFDLERPVYNPGVQTGSGIQLKISDNIELYKANLADTFNMFDTAIINGTTARRLIVNAKDSLLGKVNSDGLWVKGIDETKGEATWYSGVNAIRLPLRCISNVKIDTAFSLSIEGFCFGDPVGKFIGGAERSILSIYDIIDDNYTIDTIKNKVGSEYFIHGQKKRFRVNTDVYAPDSIEFFTFDENDTQKVFIEDIQRNEATFHDTSAFDVMEMGGKLFKKIENNYVATAVFSVKTFSKKILVKNATPYRAITNGAGYIRIMIEKNPLELFPLEWAENGRYVLHTSSPDIKIFQNSDCMKADLRWPDENGISSKTGNFYDWVKFYNFFLIPYINDFTIVYKYDGTLKKVSIEYENITNPALKKEEKIEIHLERDKPIVNNENITKIKELCDCYSGNNTEYQDCLTEAEKIGQAYMSMWTRYANDEHSWGYEYEGIPTMNADEIHSGWYCFHWAYFTHNALSKLELKKFTIQRSGWVDFSDPSEPIKHNWITLFTCSPSMNRETSNGLHLDPWIGYSPKIYTAIEHETYFHEKRNYLSLEKPSKIAAKGIRILPDGVSKSYENAKQFPRWPKDEDL